MDTGHPRNHPGPVTGQDLVAAARELIGTPYRHQGRDLRGLDCVGLWLVLLDRFGLLTRAQFTRANYGRLPGPELAERCALHCDRLQAPEAGALVLIQWPGEPSPAHAGIVTPDHIVHAHAHAGRVLEHGYREPWIRWTHSVWWFRGVARG